MNVCQQQDGYMFNPFFDGPGEDWELIWRLRKRGATMVYVPNPITHLRRVTPGQYCRHVFHRGTGIAKLFQVMRADTSGIVPQDSLLWGAAGQKTEPRWLRALWEKALGPFDWGGFPNKRLFWFFWIGAKCESAGFLWGLLRGALAAGTISLPDRRSPVPSTTERKS